MKRVLILGGGLAGLSAAVKLTGLGYRVEVLERGARPGGRVRSLKPGGHAESIDRGQHLMLGCYHESIDLAKSLGTADQLRAVKGTTPFLSGPGKVHPYRLGRLPAPLHALPGLTGLTQLSWLERISLARVVAAAKLETRLGPENLDGYSARSWLVKNGQGENALRGFWEPLVLASLNLPTGQASAQLLATVLDKGFFSRRRDAVPLLPARTLDALFVAPATAGIEAAGGKIHCSQTASELVLQGDRKRIKAVDTLSGNRFEADAVLLAVPSWDLPGLVDVHPELAWLSRSARKLSWSPIVGVELWYDRKWMHYPYAAFLDSPLQWIFNHQDRPEKTGECSGYRVSLVISYAGEQLERPSGELVEECEKEVARFFPESLHAVILNRLVVRAPRATFRAAAGTLPLRPPAETNVENLFLAGDWTATGLPATIESAVISGNRAADEIAEQARRSRT